jgi:tRNA(fMet)-specific endonuclease VapC
MNDDKPRVLDTDIVTYHQAGREAVLRRLRVVPPELIFTTVVTMREQLRGRLAAVDKAAEGAALVRAYAHLQHTVAYFHRVRVLPFDDAAAAKLAGLRAQKIRIGTQDLRIAAIVLSVGGVLVTSNRRDFEQIAGLEIEDWSASLS